MERYIFEILFIAAIFVAMIIGYLIGSHGKKSQQQHYDGKIALEDVDSENAGMFMELYIDYDQLIRRQTLAFEVENKLSQK